MSTHLQQRVLNHTISDNDWAYYNSDRAGFILSMDTIYGLHHSLRTRSEHEVIARLPLKSDKTPSLSVVVVLDGLVVCSKPSSQATRNAVN